MKTPAGRGSLVLYLDFDGVLHPENVYLQRGKGPYLKDRPGHELFEHRELLREVLEPYPEVKIVLSTSWVVQFGFSRTVKLLPGNLGERVIGATYHSGVNKHEFRSAARGMQVWGDVVRRRPADWLALDDDAFGWPAWCRDKLVKTDDIHGMAESQVLRQLKLQLAILYENSNSEPASSGPVLGDPVWSEHTAAPDRATGCSGGATG